MIEYDDEKLIRIQRIQRKFQEDLPSDKKLKYLKYLSGVPVSLEILKETSIGKTINLMRKEDGVIGQIAKQLVLKWKEIATSEYGSNIASNQQINDKKINNKNKEADDSVKHSVNKNSTSSSPNQNSSCNHSINGTSRVKGEGNSSSSPSKPKIPLEEKPKKLSNVPSKLSKKKSEDQSAYINDESLNIESKSIVPSNKLNNEKLEVRKDKLAKNEKKTNENSSDNDTDIDFQKKKKCSFEDMLMMPVLPTKKKKKKSEQSNAEILEPRMPTLPDVELPQINTVPVYRPNRPLPNLSEEMKKKIIPAPKLRFEDITSRKTKSVMYTGKKSSNGVVVSLYQMCMRVLIENVDALYETGGVPFLVLEPLLSKCTSAQLERLEYYNPHFIEDTDALWKMHCQHDFRGRRVDDDTVGAWRDMYKELSVEREEKLRRLSTKISASQAAKLPERSVKLAFVASAPKPSVQILRKQKKHGTGEKSKDKDKDKDKDNDSGEKQKEIRERMMKEQQESSDVHVPFAKVPRRDRCSKRPPSSLSSNIHNQVPEPKKQKKEEELGSSGPAALMPKPKKKKVGKKPMMLMAMKLLKKQKSRMGAPIMRK